MITTNKIKQNWHILFILGIVLAQLVAFTAWGEHSFIAVHDNLDLFVAHNTIMKNQGIFFAQDATANFVGGVSRDTLGSEFNLYNILYFLFPAYTAYVVGYFLKLFIGFTGFLLMVKDIYKDSYDKYQKLAWVVAAGFAMVPVFPEYGIAFVSLPFLVLLLRKIYLEPKVVWYVLLFAYPLVSYFSYFGIFLLAYLVLGIGILWIKNRKFPISLGTGLMVLTLGYVTWEYRLFAEMLFGDTVTIRDSMVIASADLGQMLKDVVSVFVNPGFHSESSHEFFILPVTVCALISINVIYIRKKQWKAMISESVNLVFLLIVFNCVVYGLYELEGIRKLVEMILPPLKGFQFNRTIFFNPFLWYALFFLILKWFWDKADKTGRKPSLHGGLYTAAAIGTLVCMLAPQVYNDFYSNCYHHAYEILKKTPSTQLSFEQFYSEELFEKIKEDIAYNGEWSVAYGMHPAVLQYNGISTLDGYLGLYSEEYKQQFGRLIAPALELSEEFRTTFENSGIRAYIYSGAGENTYEPLKTLNITDTNLYIDSEVFKEMNGTYVFSRINLSNADELNLELIGEYTDASSPYVIFAYKETY